MKSTTFLASTFAGLFLVLALGPAPNVQADTPGSPCLADYSNTGCLEEPPPGYPCGDDQIHLTVEGSTLHVLHTNATYNCCPYDIVISLSVQGPVLALTEEEILTDPCYCICCFEVAATIVDLAPGQYTVEFCWFDYDTNQEECYFEDIVVGGPAGDLDGDGDLDLNDFATFARCFAGTNVTASPPGCDSHEFAACDLTGDGDVDLGDFATFAFNYTGAQ